ncbi:MAG: V-type ATP synthase subunit D [Oscillospiraceae bacterium]|jgi:V/A-type H+-transporting ATPase subunit D|nr:V-type ATP synthase subunit D [Oscillospiraceae bacterium]
MAEQVFPTKGNLISAKKSLALSQVGYELMDRKRNILVREMMARIDKANELKSKIDITFKMAYAALQDANIQNGLVSLLVNMTKIESGLSINYSSVMGVELPEVLLEETEIKPEYGLYNTDSSFDYAFLRFVEVKKLLAVLAETENSVYRLAQAIKKTQKRANSLKNVVIPRFGGIVKYISSYLEEKEREDFSRLKVIKRGKEKSRPDESI